MGWQSRSPTPPPNIMPHPPLFLRRTPCPSQASAHEQTLRDTVGDLHRENATLQSRVTDLQSRLASLVSAKEQAALEFEAKEQGTSPEHLRSPHPIHGLRIACPG